jgi:hypothetical protein
MAVLLVGQRGRDTCVIAFLLPTLDSLLSKLFERHIVKQVVETLEACAQIAPTNGVEFLNQFDGAKLAVFAAEQYQGEYLNLSVEDFGFAQR